MRDRQWLVLSDGGRPTEDIYFLESAAPSLCRQGSDITRVEVARSLGAAWLQRRQLLHRHTGANVVLCRSLPAGWLRWLERHRSAFGYIAYLIDDDIPAAADDITLPAAYRKRMAGIAALQPRMLQLADEVVVCSHALALRFGNRHACVTVLTPPLIANLPSRDHFSPPCSATPWRIGFHGTRAHLNDLQHIVPALWALQASRQDTHLEVMLGKHTPEALLAAPRCSFPNPLPWPEFRQYQASHRIHIGLAPLWDTPFNQGKSFIKFLDIAAMGGVGVYSNRYPYTDIVRHGENGLLVGDSPSEWQAGLQQLLNEPEMAASMARQAAIEAGRIGDPLSAVAFWQARQDSVKG